MFIYIITYLLLQEVAQCEKGSKETGLQLQSKLDSGFWILGLFSSTLARSFAWMNGMDTVRFVLTSSLPHSASLMLAIASAITSSPALLLTSQLRQVRHRPDTSRWW